VNAKKTVIHVTHETTLQVGGITTVLEGLITSDRYRDAVGRSLLIGPWFYQDAPANLRLGPQGRVRYSAGDGIVEHPYRSLFSDIERKFGVAIVYGSRTLHNPMNARKADVEVVLIDVAHADPYPVNALKGWLFDEFGIESNRYEHREEYEQYVRLAPAALAVLRAISASDPNNPAVLISHEYVGMPTILAAILDPLGSFKTCFYAHEVATARHLAENSPGHDTMFYNALEWAEHKRYYLNEVFGPQDSYFKHPLITASRYCDNIIAVGGNTLRELQFLNCEFPNADMELAYNGVPAVEISLAQKQHSREKLRQYAHNLLGFYPDYVFTHVARLTPSKALWRDLQVLAHLEKQLRREDQRAVLFILSTDAPKRSYPDILHMEQAWNWPVAHRETYPDLSEAEASFYAAVQKFNARSQNVKAIFVNQFGWDAQSCGACMPADMEFIDIRQGTDLEFGLSIYEPFGISQFEALTFGGLCVVSSVCGCLGLMESVAGSHLPENVIVADYTRLNTPLESMDLQKILAIDRRYRDRIEHEVNAQVAQTIWQRLPQNDRQSESLIRRGYELAAKMDWNSVCQKYFLPALDNAYHKFRARQIA
jgi:glycosyltransferase involved in cell wall biosynthesis